MSVEEACKWVDQAYALGGLMIVGFSGGEPFLYLEEMKAVSEYAQERYNLPSGASTNSFWADSKNRARSVLSSLYEVGLRELLVSVDDFHQEYVPLDYVKNSVEAAKELGIHTIIQCVKTKSSHDLKYYLEALGVNKGENIQASEIPCTPLGSASTRIPQDEFITYSKIPSDYCSIFRALVVNPDGSVNLCCGPAFNVKPLSAGNLHNENLEQIVERAEWNPLYNALALGNGPNLIAETLQKNGYNSLLLEKYATSCHACHHILSQSNVISILEVLLEPQREELFLKRTILDQVTDNRNSNILKI